MAELWAKELEHSSVGIIGRLAHQRKAIYVAGASVHYCKHIALPRQPHTLFQVGDDVVGIDQFAKSMRRVGLVAMLSAHWAPRYLGTNAAVAILIVWRMCEEVRQ